MNAARSLAGRIDAVVIGTSAGGIDALSVILPSLPAAFAPPVLIVLHLPRERPSLLAEIFQPRCQIAVHEAEDKEPLAHSTAYFAPPDYHLLVEKNRTVALSEDEHVHFSRPSIDVLFESAADVYGPRLLGIILTGANSDGAEGLAAVHAARGVTVVQDPAHAYVPLMCQAAIARTPVDYVLSLSDIAALLQTIGKGGTQ